MKTKLTFIAIVLLLLNVQPVVACSVNTNNITGVKENCIFIGSKDSLTTKTFDIIPESDNLFTTHYTCFFGGNLVVDYHVSATLRLGLGVAYEHCKLHYDNGYALHNVKYWPVFVDSKVNLFNDKNVAVFADLSTGISFASYIKETPAPDSTISNILSRGLYLYAGVGYTFKLYKHLQSLMEAGFKGFNITFNQLDVNPHGLTLRVGFIIT